MKIAVDGMKATQQQNETFTFLPSLTTFERFSGVFRQFLRNRIERKNKQRENLQPLNTQFTQTNTKQIKSTIFTIFVIRLTSGVNESDNDSTQDMTI